MVICPQCNSSKRIRTIQIAMDMSETESYVPPPCALSCKCGKIFDIPDGIKIVEVGPGEFVIEEEIV